MNAREALPEQGSLAEVPFPQLLVALYEQRFSGRLELSRGRTKKAFVLQDGAPIASESNLPAERLTGVLEQSGALSIADRDRVDEMVVREKCKEGVALMKLELIEPKALFHGLREQLRHRAIDTFGWVNGEWALVEAEERSENVQPFRTDPYKLVQEGLRTHWSVDRLLVGMQERMDLYPRPSKRMPRAMRRLELDAAVERMIAGLNGSQPLGVLVCGAGSSPATVATFWVLDAIGALDYSETPVRAGTDADGDGPVDIEIHIRGESDSASDTSGAAPVTNAPARTAASDGDGPAVRGLGPEGEAMRAELSEKLVGLEELNYYELLDVPADAALSVIRKAYFKAAKRYHPDAIARLGLEDLRADAGELFSKIALANETLSDAGKRKDYDLSLSGERQVVDVTTIAQAETFYRKGEILLRMGDFRGALDYLKNAVDLYPEEAAYQSDLGWAYYKKEPPERELGLEHLAKALELDPGNSVAQFRVGVIRR